MEIIYAVIHYSEVEGSGQKNVAALHYDVFLAVSYTNDGTVKRIYSVFGLTLSAEKAKL